MPAPSGSARTVAVSSGRRCPRRSREIDRGRWREGRGGLAARGRAGSPPHVWCTASAKSPPAELAVHPFVAEWLRQVPGGAEQQQPALSGRSQGCRPPLQRRLGPARPAPSPARPGAGRLDGSRSCIVQRAEAQRSGFRAGGRLAKVVAKAFWSGMTRGERTGGEWTAASMPMPAQPRGSRCASSHSHIQICVPRREAPAAGCGAHRGGC